MDTTPINTTIATANALHRMLRQGLLAKRSSAVAATRPVPASPSVDDGDTLPLLYRSEAFAEDLLDPA